MRNEGKVLQIAHYIFVGGDVHDINDKIVSAYEVALRRISLSYWPLYQSTKWRTSLRRGDQCLIYLAGNKVARQHVVATARIESVKLGGAPGVPSDHADWLTDLPASIAILGDIQRFETPVPLRPLLDSLSFIPKNRGKWGAALQGGCRQITEGDASLIIRQSKALKSIGNEAGLADSDR